MIHYTAEYLLNPQHRITIDLVGCGGTGSQVLNNLGRIHHALQGLGHPGLFVTAWDFDEVSPANLGRQLFSKSDLGINKATALIGRVNRFFGIDWHSRSEEYTGNKSNILITCVDTAKARITISGKLKEVETSANEPYEKPYYWLDLGNLQFTGQVVLGTLGTHTKNKGSKNVLPDVIKKFPGIKKIKEDNQGPSCSLAEALEKQDLFINSILAQFGCNLLWKLIREGSIKYHGCFVNLETLSVNPIKI